MAGRLLLDTSLIVELLRQVPAAARIVADAEEVYVSAVALGEVFYGAEGSSQRELGLAQVEGFAAAANVLHVDVETARQYGSIRAELKRKGRPIPENDIWIAATAKQHLLTLVTRDAHFREVRGPPDPALVAWGGRIHSTDSSLRHRSHGRACSGGAAGVSWR